MNKETQNNNLETLLKQKFDNELKDKWARKLKDDYGVGKSNINKRKDNTPVIKLILAVAACLILFFTITINTSKSAQDLAQNYTAETQVFHPGTIKGTPTNQEQRSVAIKAFNRKEYDNAINHFKTILAENTKGEDYYEDMYFLGLAYLLNKNYSQATQIFQQVSEGNNAFSEEINWYLGLSLTLENKNLESKKVLEQISPNQWNFKEATKLLKSINNQLKKNQYENFIYISVALLAVLCLFYFYRSTRHDEIQFS